MKLFKKVAIVGAGLIGGSIGLALKKYGLADEVVGVTRHKKNLLLAKKRKAIDRGSVSLDIIRDADLVILATPVNTIIKLAPAVSRIVCGDCIITDVGSTKKEIVLALEKLFPRYIGSHPLAGSEKRSVSHAHADIFKDTLCILTTTKNSDRRALNLLKIFWGKLGARRFILSPEAHDKILSFVSHLPHAAAFSLIAAVPREFLKFSSAGLRDTTRIAASDSELWADILLSNSKNISQAITLFQGKLSGLNEAIRSKDRNRLIKILKAAKDKREAINS